MKKDIYSFLTYLILRGAILKEILMDKIELKKLIETNQDSINFGSPESAPSDYWVKKAEDCLGLKFTDSYKWFLLQYGGGDINGVEIFSLYCMNFEEAIGGDIVYNYLIDLNKGFHIKNELVVSRTDFGEEFFFNYELATDNECPIFRRIGFGESHLYANDFYEFLYKMINENIL